MPRFRIELAEAIPKTAKITRVTAIAANAKIPETLAMSTLFNGHPNN
jgi:hypothetical protein